MNSITEQEKELVLLLKSRNVDKDSMIGLMLTLQDDEQLQKELAQWIRDNPNSQEQDIISHTYTMLYGDDELDD